MIVYSINISIKGKSINKTQKFFGADAKKVEEFSSKRCPYTFLNNVFKIRMPQ